MHSLEACARLGAGRSPEITTSINNSACNHALKPKLALFYHTLWEDYV